MLYSIRAKSRGTGKWKVEVVKRSLKPKSPKAQKPKSLEAQEPESLEARNSQEA